MIIILVVFRMYNLHRGSGNPITGFIPEIGPLKTMSPIPKTSAKVIRKDAMPKSRDTRRPNFLGNR